MYPGKLITDHRLPGQPFLDVASGAYIKPSNSAGACWACPAVDSDGNFVVAERNGSGLTSGKTGADQVSSKYTTNNGCTIKQKYKPPAFPEPGLSGLAGVKELLFEKQILIRPNDLTTYLNAVATKNNVPKPQNWVAAQWTDIAQHPYANNQIRALVLQYMKRKAPAYMYPNGQVPTSASAAETTLINSFQAYTQARKTYTAQQVLNMYDAWNTFQQEYSPIQSQLSQFFSYGVVPPDLKSMASGLVGLTGAAVGAFASGAMAANILTAAESANTAYSNTARSAEIAVAISKIAQNMAIVEEGAAVSSEATGRGRKWP